jgi:ribonuclease VapC
MTGVVLDASAVLAFLRREPGADCIEPHLAQACISAISYAEVIQKGIDAGACPAAVRNAVDLLQLEVVPFDRNLALIAAELWPITREAGLSMAERCSLALAKLRSLPVLTADREWEHLRIGIEIECIR